MIRRRGQRRAASLLGKFHLNFTGRDGLERDRENQRGKRDTERGD